MDACSEIVEIQSLEGIERGRLPRSVEERLEEELGRAKRVAVIAGCVGFEAKLSLVSCAVRLREEYGIDKLIVLATPRTRRDSCTALEALRVLGFEGVVVEASDEPGLLERAARRRVEFLAPRVGSENVVTCISPGSRRLAAALALASSGTSIVHLDFWWGPWQNLAYPFIPRPLEPLYIIHPASYGKTELDARCCSYSCDGVLQQLGRALGGRFDLKGLRGCVARKACELNVKCKGFVRHHYQEARCSGCKITLTTPINNLAIIVEDWCDPESWIEAAKSLAERIPPSTSPTSKIPLLATRLLAAASGFYWWIVELDGEGQRLLFEMSSPIAVDTNLVYKGVHVELLMGARIALPWAVVAEIERGFAEALKRASGFQVEKTLPRLIAGLLLREVRRYAPILPSGPPPADTAMIRMDPLILENYVLVTEDTGAYNLWRQYPASRIARIARAQLSSEPWDWDRLDARMRAARAAYAIIHMACLAEQLASLLKEAESVTGIAALEAQLGLFKLEATLVE